MEKISWEKRFRVNVTDIDLQHEYFLSLINRLADNFAQSENGGYKLRLLEELAQYASFHFISEENLMIKSNYPSFKEHVVLHRKLLNQLNDKINYFKMQKETEETVLHFLVDWFVHHTLEEDAAFGYFFNGTKGQKR